MNAVFDTLKAVKALREAGFEEAQAEAVVQTVGEAVTETVTTKSDLALTRTELIGKIEQSSAEAKSEIATLKADIFKQLWIMGAGIVAVTVTLIKLI